MVAVERQITLSTSCVDKVEKHFQDATTGLLIYRPSQHVCCSNGWNTASANARNTHANNPLEFNETVNGIKDKPVHKCLQDEGQHYL